MNTKLLWTTLLLLFYYCIGPAQTQVGADIEGENATDISGSAVSLSANGTRVAIGAPENDDLGTDAGQVRVYEWRGNAWVQLGSDINGAAAGDKFGTSVALSGNGLVLAIGAPNNDGNGTDAGHVRIFEWNGTAWSQRGLALEGAALGDNFGESIAISSDGAHLAVSAPDHNGLIGQVKMYQWNNTSWVPLGQAIDGMDASDLFGYAVAIDADGDRVAISAPSFNNVTAGTKGQVYVYDLDAGGSWILAGTPIDGPIILDLFGWSIALSPDGDHLAIGAPFNNDGGTDAGKVTVFKWDGTTWGQTGPSINGVAASNFSGNSVSLSVGGTRLAIGARNNSDVDIAAGHTRVFQWDSGSANWVLDGTAIEGQAREDRSGWAVSLSHDGSRVAIGAPGNDSNSSGAGNTRVFEWSSNTSSCDVIYGVEIGEFTGNAVDLSADGSRVAIGAYWNNGGGIVRGRVRVFDRVGNQWVQVGMDLVGITDYENFGAALSLSSDGNRLAIGAPNNSNGGQVRVYDLVNGVWDQAGPTISGAAIVNRFGTAVSLSGDGTRLAVSGPDNSNVNGLNAGHVQVFRWDIGSMSWMQIGQDIEGEVAGDRAGSSFGSLSLSTDGNTLAIGAPNNDGNGINSGHVRIFEWDGTNWPQKGLDIDGEMAGDEAGYGLDLSADGDRVTIGSWNNDGNGSNSGHARIFEWNTGSMSWVQMGMAINGEVAGDQSGAGVALSSDGNIVAIGAMQNDGNGPNAGHVRFFEWNNACMCWSQLGFGMDGIAEGDQLGATIALSSDGLQVAAGAVFNNAGHVQLCTVNASSGSAAANCLSFSNSDDRITIPSPITGTDDFTLECWFYSDNISTMGQISHLFTWGAAGTRFDVGESNGNLAIFANDGSTAQTYRGTTNVRDGQWHLVSITRSQNDFLVYLDGVQELSFSSAIQADATILVGHLNSTNIGNTQWVGAIDELRMWSSAMTATEIQGTMNCELKGNETCLVGYWPFNQGNANANNSSIISLTDLTSNANHGTLTSFLLTGGISNWISSGANVSGTCAGVTCLTQFLPVELLSFYANKEESAIGLHWQTASELNNRGFEVQQSTNGLDWRVIGFVEGHGTTQRPNRYNYADAKPIPGPNYYRLKQLDYDEAFEYSKVLMVEWSEQIGQWKLFPNPVRDQLTITGEPGDAILYTLDGQPLLEWTIFESTSTVDVSDLPAGLYILTIVDALGSRHIQKFTK